MTPPATDTNLSDQDIDPSRGRRIFDLAVFAIVALVFMFVIGPLATGVDFSNRDLIDTDGHMRYLRIEQLLDGGEWFDPMSMRSNFPYGETQHWTRIVDVYVIGISWLLWPFMGDAALYGAAVINGPLLLIAIGAAAAWAFSAYIPKTMRSLTMPMIMVLAPVVMYAFPGRVDHHAPIMLAFVVALGWLLRLSTNPTPRVATHLGLWLALGMWISVEFLIFVAITALVVGIRSAMHGQREVANTGARVFSVAAISQALFVLIERGPGWANIELDRLSLVHVVLAVAIAGVFGVYARVPTGAVPWKRFGLLALLTVVGLGLVVAWHPALAKGPFGEVDPVVQEIWLFHVAELIPLFGRPFTPALLPFVVPVVLALIAGIVQIRRRTPNSGFLYFCLLVYTGLMIGQIRWAPFAQLIGLPFLVTALAGTYARMDRLRFATLIRPLVLALVIVAFPLAGMLLGSSEPRSSANCRLPDALDEIAATPQTTVFGTQDVGPQILYRTNHNVVATPYHRNEAGILFIRDVMSLTDVEEARQELATRDVGLILICVGRDDITKPPDTDGTFYSDLTEGRLPGFVSEIPLAAETDWKLFAIAQ